MEPAPLSDLVTRARAGDRQAWNGLVDRYLGLVHAICRGHHLGADDAADVNRAVWRRLVEHLDRVRDPQAVGGWIAATARHECLRLSRAAGPSNGTRRGGVSGGDTAGVDTGLLVYQRDRDLMTAFAQLDDRCRQMLRLLMVEPAPADDELAAALDVPEGCVDPRRRQSLEQLRHVAGSIP